MSTVIENALTIEEIEAEALRVQEEAQRRLEELEARRKEIEEAERAELHAKLLQLMEDKEKLEADIQTIQVRLNPHRGSVTKTGKRRGRPKGSKNKPKNVDQTQEKAPEVPQEKSEPEKNDDTVVESTVETVEVTIPEVQKSQSLDDYIEAVLMENRGVKFTELELAEAVSAAGFVPPEKKLLLNLVYTAMFQYFKTNDEETSLIKRVLGSSGKQYYIE